MSRTTARLIAAVFAAYMVPTWAEESASRRIEEVIVTAEKREASIQDTSISITAFTGEFLDDFGIRNQEDLQNYIPATTIQPYDATIRGVGRNFRALGGDPGVSTYMNGIYSEDLLTATAATFFDVERIEILRGPQGTLFGRNAVGGAVNIIYREPTQEWQGELKAIAGNFGQQEYYGALSGPVIQDVLAARVTLAYRDRDGVVDDIGRPGHGIDGLGTESYAMQLLFTPFDRFSMKLRMNQMDIKRSFGGANGGGLTVLNEGQGPGRVFDALVGGFRRIDRTNTDPANILQNDFFDQNAPVFTFNDPFTGAPVEAQRIRAGIDPDTSANNSLTGFLNAAATLDGFGKPVSAETRALYNSCVFNGGHISGDDNCAATNGLNVEEFEQNGYQFESTWDVTDTFSVKYLFGYNVLSYERITDDDNTGSLFSDRQFYVNHEANYRSNELQFLYQIGPSISMTSGVFFYSAEIDQRGDFYDSLRTKRFTTTMDPLGLVSAVFGPNMPTLFTSRTTCSAAGTCPRNTPGVNAVLGPFLGDPGTNRALTVEHGNDTPGSDLLYTTETRRRAFAAYTQGAWDINDKFTLTLGGRLAIDRLKAEENLWRYSELDGLFGLFPCALVSFNPTAAAACAGNDANGDGVDELTVAAYNLAAGGLIANPDGTFTPTNKVVNGFPVALSVFRRFARQDTEWDWRVNLDYNINDDAMVYFSATRAHRSGGYNLVFFSQTFTYNPEELINYEVGYKTDWFDRTLQINGSFYFYDYQNIHTVGTEVSGVGGTSTSVLEAPGARVIGVETEGTWLVTDNLTVGGNVSFTPSKYTRSLLIADPTRAERPATLFDTTTLTEDIKGNQLLQVPEWKFTLWGNYRINFPESYLDLRATYAFTDEVYYSPFERDQEKADAYGRTDLRATWTSTRYNVTVAGFVNNVFNNIGSLQVLRQGEEQFFRHTLGTTVPRAYGVEVSYSFGNY